MKTFEILFVRHALSCANVWKERGTFKAHLRYHDPEITTEGIQRSIEVGKQIQYPFNTSRQEPFTIGASVMLRAQQTAYLMFAKRMNKPIFIVPYIGEIYPTPDNMPSTQEEQRKRYAQNPAYTQTPSLDELIYNRGVNFRSISSYRHMLPFSSFKKFLDWIQKDENEGFFGKGSDGIYRAVLVTHSGFMGEHFPLQTVKKYKNNDGVLVRIEVDGKDSNITTFGYLPAGESDNHYDVCPDKACHNPPPCKTGGGKRKTRKALHPQARGSRALRSRRTRGRLQK